MVLVQSCPRLEKFLGPGPDCPARDFQTFVLPVCDFHTFIGPSLVRDCQILLLLVLDQSILVRESLEGADIPPLSLYIVNIEITNYDSRKYGQKQS